MKRTIALALIAAVAGPLAGRTLADSIVVKGVAYNDVRISGVKGEDITFTTSTGNETRKPLTDVTKINIEGEAAFNSAKEAYASRSYERAVDGYQKTVQGTNKPWLKEWAAFRLLESANKGGRFDAAVRSYIALAEKNPETARAITLTIPGKDSAYLKAAVPLLKQGMDSTAAKPAANELITKLTIDVYKAMGDAKAEEDLTEKMVKDQMQRDPNSPAALRARVTMLLSQARKSLDAKDYDRVVQGITAEAANINDPGEQADALFYIAEAKRGKAEASKDAKVWKDVAVSYMRVVANFSGSPRAAEALLKVADIHKTRLNDKETAVAILRRMIDEEYKDKEPAKEAERQLANMK